jgi:hypothetical protein
LTKLNEGAFSPSIFLPDLLRIFFFVYSHSFFSLLF